MDCQHTVWIILRLASSQEILVRDTVERGYVSSNSMRVLARAPEDLELNAARSPSYIPVLKDTFRLNYR